MATGWDSVSEVWHNQDEHGCLHSNLSLGDLGPGETASAVGRVVLVEGTVEDVVSQLGF